MKNVLWLLLVIALVLGPLLATPAIAAEGSIRGSEILYNDVQFDVAGAAWKYYGPYIVIDQWRPVTQLTTDTIFTFSSDSLLSFPFASTVYNSADSGAVAVDLCFSNILCRRDANNDSLIFPASDDTIKVKWFKDAAALLYANVADTVILHTSVTSDQTPTSVFKQVRSNVAYKYMYVRYTAGAANSAENHFLHRMVCPPYPGSISVK